MGHVSTWTAPAETLQRRGSGVRRLGVGVLGISDVSGGSQAAGGSPGQSLHEGTSFHKGVVCVTGKSPSSVP